MRLKAFALAPLLVCLTQAPPPLDACIGLATGAACSFTGKKVGFVSDTCRANGRCGAPPAGGGAPPAGGGAPPAGGGALPAGGGAQPAGSGGGAGAGLDSNATSVRPDNTKPAGAIVGTLLGVFAAIVGIVVGCRARKHKYAAQVVPQMAPPRQQVAAQQAQQQQRAMAHNSNKLFLSYARGDESTPFARRLKAYLEEHGFDVWMDEEGIAGDANFMSASASAIMDASGMVAVIDQKFCGSTYCNNELAMGQGQGLHLFPILFRSLRFDAMPHGLQYMLATTNVVPFPEPASDEAGLQKLTAQMRTTLVTDFAKVTMRHGDSASAALQGQGQNAEKKAPIFTSSTLARRSSVFAGAARATATATTKTAVQPAKML